MKKILFVCHGNICRSPMAEFVMKDLVKKAGLASQFHIESAATSREEIGNPVYPPARRKLAEHGISCGGHAARQLTNRDYEEYDLLIGMDRANLRDMAGTLQKAWEEGWLDEYSNEHFLIKALEGRLVDYPRLYSLPSSMSAMYPIREDTFQLNFCMNFSAKIKGLLSLFGEPGMERFFKDQLSAGKDNYDEDQFFRALSEVSVLCFFAANAKSGEYEPKTNGKKNPEARLVMNNDVIVDVEVKTPGFRDFKNIIDIVIPTVLLDNEGRDAFLQYCDEHEISGHMPRVQKLKDFLNSAADKFEPVDHVNHMNLLYINWSYSEFEEEGYQEAFSLLANNSNGILTHKNIGLNLGLKEEVYDKITAIVVYTESLHGLMFGEFRFVWMRDYMGQPHFGIIPLHDEGDIFKVTGINPYSEQLTPIFTGFLREPKHSEALIQIIGEHMLKL